MTTEEISLLKINSYLMPNEGPVSSSIKIIESNEKGFRFRRIHQYYNGEEFFLSKEALMKSNWVIVPKGIQLLLF